MEQNLSLYFDLEEKQLVDIEVVSKSAIAWSAAIKDIAAHIDPGMQISVQLESGTKGSLSLNSLIKQVGPYISDPMNIRVAIITTLIYLAQETGAWGINKILDYLNSDDAKPITQLLSESEKRKLAEAVVRELQAKTGRDNLSLVFREANKDRSIKGIGATAAKNKRPKKIISREEFNSRFAEQIEIELEAETREQVERMKVILIRPVLVNDTNRVWRFRSFTGEFSANVKDTEFFDKYMTGNESIPLIEGLQLDVLLQAIQEKDLNNDNVWVPKSYSVLRIYGFEIPQSQSEFTGFTPPK